MKWMVVERSWPACTCQNCSYSASTKLSFAAVLMMVHGNFGGVHSVYRCVSEQQAQELTCAKELMV